MAERKIKYGTPVAMTVTNLHGLASSSTRTAGWGSTVINNTSNLYLDLLIGGELKVNNSAAPTSGTVLSIFAFAAYDVTPTYPAIFSSGTAGTEGALTVTDEEERNSSLVALWSAVVDTSTGAVHSMPPMSLAAAFGGVLPPYVVIFAAHNTGQNLHTSGNVLYYIPITETIS